MKTLVLVGMWAAVKAVKFLVSACAKQLTPDGPMSAANTVPIHTPLLLEEYSSSTIEAYRSLTREKWVALKDSIQYETKVGRQSIIDCASPYEFVGETRSRDLTGYSARYHDPDDGTTDCSAEGLIMYPKWWPAGNGGRPRCGYRGFKPISKSVRHLFAAGNDIGMGLHAADLDRHHQGYPWPPTVSAKRLADGIDIVIARCPSASWKIGKGTRSEMGLNLAKLKAAAAAQGVVVEPAPVKPEPFETLADKIYVELFNDMSYEQIDMFVKQKTDAFGDLSGRPGFPDNLDEWKKALDEMTAAGIAIIKMGRKEK